MVSCDSRIGFEASNHYYYTEASLKEKILNCRHLLDKVYPEECSIVKKDDIVRALYKLGIRNGDLVLVHSSLRSPGYIVGGAKTVVSAFLEAVGPDGTLAMPALSMKDFENAYRTWHIDKPSDAGYITEVFRKTPGVLRSDQATHSVTAAGKRAADLTEGHTAFGSRYGVFGDTPFSHSSPWQKMYDWGGKVVFFGVTMRKNTFKHFMEYRIVEKALESIADDAERARLKAMIWHHSRWNERGIWPFHNGEQLQAELDKAGMIKKAGCGDAIVMALDIREMVDTGTKWFEDDPARWYKPQVVQWLAEAKAGSTADKAQVNMAGGAPGSASDNTAGNAIHGVANNVPAETQVVGEGPVKIECGNECDLRVLFVGCSTTWHKPNKDIGWENDWGMAASKRENDYVHLVMGNIRKLYPNTGYCIAQVSRWEKQYWVGQGILECTYKDAAAFGADIIIINTTGANAPKECLDKYPYSIYYEQMIDFFNKKGNAKVVLTTSFFDIPTNIVIRETAVKRNYPLVDLLEICSSDSMRATELFEHKGVAAHLGDKGMLAFAKKLMELLGYL